MFCAWSFLSFLSSLTTPTSGKQWQELKDTFDKINACIAIFDVIDYNIESLSLSTISQGTHVPVCD